MGGEKLQEEDTPLLNNGVGKEGGPSRPKESVVSALMVSGGATNASNGKPPKKKVKTVKKRWVWFPVGVATLICFTCSSKVTITKDKETLPSAPPPAHVPMPDLTSQPLDPNEPTYCLCQQVSFGEMIGCDNDDVSSQFIGHKSNRTWTFECVVTIIV